MEWKSWNRIAIYYSVWALIWFISFIISCNSFIISTLCVFWYFGRHEHTFIHLPTAVFWSQTYNLGTLAFGSFLVALLWVILFIFNYIYKKLKDYGKNKEANCLKCIICFVSCFERLLRYLNKHIYIEVAIRSTNYCTSAARAYDILTSNFVRFAILSGLVDLFLILGSLLISIITTLIGYLMIKLHEKSFNVEIETSFPLVLIFLIAFCVTLIFNHVFEVTADTMLHCYVIDEEEI